MKKNQWLIGCLAGVLGISANFSACAGFVDERSSNQEARDMARPSVASSQTAPSLGAMPTNKLIDAVEPTRVWAILPADGRLATVFERWTKDAGHRLVWDAQQHVMLSTVDRFEGTFSEAVKRVLSSPAIRNSAYPLEACLYPNQPAVLRVTKLGDQSKECPQ